MELTKEQLLGTKYAVLNEQDSREFQEWAFAQGFPWAGGRKVVEGTHYKYLFLENDSRIRYSNSMEYFKNKEWKQIYKNGYSYNFDEPIEELIKEQVPEIELSPKTIALLNNLDNLV